MEIKEILDGLKSDFEAFKTANDQRIEEIAKKGVADPILVEKQQKIEARIDELSALKAQVEQLEVLANRPNMTGGEKDFSKEEVEHKQAFENWIRNPRDAKASQELGLAQKAVATTSNAAGGYAVPEIISRQIAEKLQDISPMRRILTVQTVGSSDYKELVDVNGEAFGWVGETGTRSETGTSQLEEAAPTMGTIYAYPKATEESLDDMFFNVGSWLVRKTSVAFAKGEGAAFVSGNGTNKPTGFLNGTPTTEEDEGSPFRAFQTLQYLPTGVAANFANDQTGSPAGNPGDVFIDVAHKLKSGYTAGAVWLMNRTVMGAVRKFKDANGEYLFAMSNNAGEMGNLIGYPIIEMPDMPNVGANAFPVAFGNFNEGYLAVDRTELRITVDDNITTPGYVKWYVRRRLGGIVKNDDAIKLIKCATS